MILFIFNLQVTHILPTKFQVNWPFGSGEEAKNIFSRWPSRRHLGFPIAPSLAIFDPQVARCFFPNFKSIWFRGKKKNRFSRWWPKRPASIFNGNNFSFLFIYLFIYYYYYYFICCFLLSFESNGQGVVVVVRIFNATRHPRHIEAAAIVTCMYCTALLSWLTHAHLVPLSVTKRRPVHFILNPGYVEYELGVLMTRAGFEPTISRLKVNCANH